MCLLRRVRKINEIIELIKFFDKYPLISRKRGDYLLFKEIVSIMQMKEHLTLQGIQKIINIKATLNFGLSKELQLMFPETIPVLRRRPLRETCVISHSQWIAGLLLRSRSAARCARGDNIRENRSFSLLRREEIYASLHLAHLVTHLELIRMLC